MRVVFKKQIMHNNITHYQLEKHKINLIDCKSIIFKVAIKGDPNSAVNNRKCTHLQFQGRLSLGFRPPCTPLTGQKFQLEEQLRQYWIETSLSESSETISCWCTSSIVRTQMWHSEVVSRSVINRSLKASIATLLASKVLPRVAIGRQTHCVLQCNFHIHVLGRIQGLCSKYQWHPSIF